MDDAGSGIPPPTPMFTPAQERQLKIAVMVMGVILLIGFAAVIGRILYLVNQAPRPAASALPAAGLAVGALAVPNELALPKGAVVRHISLSGNVLAVHFDGPLGAGIRIVELATAGRVLSLPIVEEPARR